jgi:hypothetical protein
MVLRQDVEADGEDAGRGNREARRRQTAPQRLPQRRWPDASSSPLVLFFAVSPHALQRATYVLNACSLLLGRHLLACPCPSPARNACLRIATATGREASHLLFLLGSAVAGDCCAAPD